MPAAGLVALLVEGNRCMFERSGATAVTQAICPKTVLFNDK